MKIKTMQQTDRPRERLVNLGETALSDIELLALILQSGLRGLSALTLAQQLIFEFGSFHKVFEADFSSLVGQKGIGPVKACELKAVYEIGKRIFLRLQEEVLQVTNPRDIFRFICKDCTNKSVEHLYLLCLDQRNRIIAKTLLTVGTINETLIHPREIYRQAFLKNASAIILIHNHPSQDCTPSPEDIFATKKIAEVGTLVGIPLLDHVIVSDTDFCSLKSLHSFSGKSGGDTS